MAIGVMGQRETVVTLRNKRLAATANRTTSSGVSAATRRQVSSLFAEAKKIYEPGGGFMAGTEAAISRGSKRAVASGVQQLASAGLAGTSIVGGLGKKYEEEVGMPTRARATTARLGALAGLLQAEAGATASLATRYSTSPSTSYGGGGGGSGGFAPRPATSKRQPMAATTPQAQPLPRLNLPGVKRPSGRAPEGGRKVSVYNPYTYTGVAERRQQAEKGSFQYYNI